MLADMFALQGASYSASLSSSFVDMDAEHGTCITRTRPQDGQRYLNKKSKPSHRLLQALIPCPKDYTEGQLISIWLFGIIDFLQKRTNKFNFTTIIPQIDLFLFVFWRNSTYPKNHFEIN